jgi:hypothetical protein
MQGQRQLLSECYNLSCETGPPNRVTKCRSIPLLHQAPDSPADSNILRGGTMAYSTPQLTRYGSVSARTGVFGALSTGDVLLDESGNVVARGVLSIDACAQEGGKCICTDEGTC